MNDISSLRPIYYRELREQEERKTENAVILTVSCILALAFLVDAIFKMM
jgi:hypothetical protein